MLSASLEVTVTVGAVVSYIVMVPVAVATVPGDLTPVVVTVYSYIPAVVGIPLIVKVLLYGSIIWVNPDGNSGEIVIPERSPSNA